MTEPTKSPDVQQVDNLLQAPIVFFDAIPGLVLRGPVLSVVLATHVGAPETSTTTSDHLVAVANLRFTLATAAKLRDVLEKVLLAASPRRAPQINGKTGLLPCDAHHSQPGPRSATSEFKGNRETTDDHFEQRTQFGTARHRERRLD